ncbi:hypothetical protein TNCV_3634991 [Trichonephila clavipes]|nr:hypothetical protein TNCV_3634991 [Trichonephila clavipes]
MDAVDSPLTREEEDWILAGQVTGGWSKYRPLGNTGADETAEWSPQNVLVVHLSIAIDVTPTLSVEDVRSP